MPTAAAQHGAKSARTKPTVAKASAKSQTWRCERCDVTISYMVGHERKGPPAGWSKSGGSSHCLRCRRAEAAEEAIERAPESTTREERAKIRAAAILDFEILRDPDRPNGEIAKVVRCSVPAVVKSRRRIEAQAKPAKRR